MEDSYGRLPHILLICECEMTRFSRSGQPCVDPSDQSLYEYDYKQSDLSYSSLVTSRAKSSGSFITKFSDRPFHVSA